MSRKRSRADAPGGPKPLAEQAPLYARNPRGFLRPVEVRGGWRPAWRTPAFRPALIVLVGVPLAIIALVFLFAAIQAIFVR